MILRDVLPHQALSAFIQCYRICHFKFDSTKEIPVKTWAPRPETTLHFVLRGNLTVQPRYAERYVVPAIALLGQRTTLVEQLTGDTILNVHLVLQPTAIHLLTGLPANEVTDRCFDASLIFGVLAKTTYDQLQNANSYERILSIVEAFAFELVKRARRTSDGIDAIARRMIVGGGNASMDTLADEACLCTKQFKRKFFERVGVNPKTYSRIIRLNKAYSLRNAFPSREWLDIAIQCGYADYQHLAKDYKAFTGATPAELHLLDRGAPERILGLTDSLFRERAARYAHLS